MTFLKLVDKYDRNISVRLACSRSLILFRTFAAMAAQIIFLIWISFSFYPQKADFSACYSISSLK